MRSNTILIIMMLMSNSLFAQILTKEPGIFQTFKVYGGFGASHDINLSALRFYIEPQMSLLDKIQVGYRYEYYTDYDPNNAIKNDLLKTQAHLITGEYIHGIRSFRPFINFGIGTARTQYYTNSTNMSNMPENTNSALIIMPQVGFNAGVFRLSLGTTIGGKNPKEDKNPWGFTFGLGVRWGGKQKTIVVY